MKIRIHILLCFLSLSLPRTLPAAQSPKLYIRSVTFAGNAAFSDARLQKLMLSRPGSFLGRVPYRPEVLRDDLAHIERFYHQNGYLEAAVLSHTVMPDTAAKRVDVHVRLEEGNQTRVAEVGILGNRHFSYGELLEAIPVRPGEPFQAQKMERAMLNLLRKYAEAGFIGADVQPNAERDTTFHRMWIQFAIEEGRRYRVGEIRIQGLVRTRPRVVLRECLFSPGEWIQYSRLLDSQRALYLTGLFGSVYVVTGDPPHPDSTRIPIHIELAENKSAEFLVAAGYGTVDKLRGRVELNHQNLGGTALKAGVKLGMSFIHRGAEVSVTEPWTFGTRWRSDMNFLAHQQEEPGYDYSRIGGRAMIGRSFSRRISLKFSGRIDRTWLKNVRVTTVPDRLKSDLRSLGVTLTYDSRDNLFDSSRGFYCEWGHELGRVFSGGADGFYRTLFLMRGFHSLPHQTVIGSGLELGWMTLPGGVGRIPLQERFYAGGPNSLRGFGYQRVGPADAGGVPTGGQFKWVWHVAEIRKTLYRMIGAAAFLDAGGVWEDPADWRWSSVRGSAGLGLRISTPLGVARLDFGVNLDPRPNERRSLWQFSMGQAF
ncbi:MAG TPA: outer membrane protein assembly factor BamA [bacterium]|nr:outer membrane protein assembly factor BamA [bacterium]